MQDKEFLDATEKLLEQFTKQIGGLVIDIGLLNTVWMEITRRKNELQQKG